MVHCIHEEHWCWWVLINEVSQHILCNHEEGLWLGTPIECACQDCTVSTQFYVDIDVQTSSEA